MIPLCVPEIRGNESKYINECLSTNWVSSAGQYVNLFEDKFRKYIGIDSAVVTMNGTAALTLALQTLGLKPGDEIIVPSMTFIASVNPIAYIGAIPVFAEVDPDTWVLDVSKVEELITDKTKAIIPVHLYGNVVDMEPLTRLARKYRLYVIEDATEALGAEYRTNDGVWRKAGSIGDFGVFSFNGNKLITTGAGGMLVTNNRELGNRAKYLSNQTKTALPNNGFYHDEIGYNYRLPNLLAAMGVAQLEKIDEYLNKKLEHANLYNSLLKDIPGIKLSEEKENVKHAQWLYSIVVNEDYPINRDALIEKMKKSGIETRPFFYPVHKMKPYYDSNIEFIITDEISQRGINLPSSVGLTNNEIEFISSIINYRG